MPTEHCARHTPVDSDGTPLSKHSTLTTQQFQGYRNLGRLPRKPTRTAGRQHKHLPKLTVVSREQEQRHRGD